MKGCQPEKKFSCLKNKLTSLVLIPGFRVGLSGLNLGYPETQSLNPENPAKAGFINIFLCGFELS